MEIHHMDDIRQIYDTRSQEYQLYMKLMDYYKPKNGNETNLRQMLNLISGNQRISISIIEWFVTNYAKQHYTIINDNFIVFDEYKTTLNYCSKERFDPFCRKNKILISDNNGVKYQTTLGQLNFFFWVLNNGIIAHIETNYEKINTDMKTRKKDSSLKNTGNPSDQAKTRKKRQELSTPLTKMIKKEDNIRVYVKFT